jgi:hypothetical protein
MSKFRLLKSLLSIWVLGLIPATLISHALSQEKTFQLPDCIPTLQQKFAISIYNYSRKINDGPKTL